MAESSYAAKSRRYPAWRDGQIAAAKKRDRRRRERDPDAYRAQHRAAIRRRRERQRAHGLTFTQLLARSPVTDPAVLRTVLRDEVRRGTIEFSTATRRYRLNGALPEDVRQAIRDL